MPNKKAQVCLFGSITLSTLAYALPEGESVIRGQVDFNKSSHEWMIQQHTDKAVVDYQKFSVDKNERVEFIQPSSNSVLLNRVVGGDMSNILGAMQSNGKIFLVNPAGIVVGKDAHINVGGLVASTLNIDADDFMNGNYSFDIEKNADAIAGAIQQQGVITAQDGGFIILLSPQIQQQGMLIAQLGRVELASADAATVSLDFTDLPAVSLTKASWKGWIDQHGKIDAESGVVRLTVASAMDLLARAVQPQTKQANTVVEKDGRVFLIAEDEKNPHLAGEIRQTGELKAQRNRAQGNKGAVQVQADYIQHSGKIDVSAKNSDAGTINLKANKALTLESKSLLKADAMNKGTGGKIIAKAPQTIFRSNAFISANGGENVGDGGFVEVSGFNLVEIFGEVSTYSATGKQGQFLIDPRDVTISSASSNNTSFAGNTYTPTGAGSIIDVTALETSLQATDVIVTTDDGGIGGEDGNITVDAVIDFNGTDGNTLTLLADGDININANMADLTPNVGTLEATNVVLDAQGDIFMQAGRVIDAGSGTIRITTAIGNINLASIQTENATSSAIALISGGSILDANAGSINITANETNARTSITAPAGTEELEVLLNQLTLNVDNTTSLTQASGDLSIAGITSTNLLGDINLTLENGGVTLMSAALGGAGAQIAGTADLNITLETLDLNSNNLLNINHTLAYTGTGNIIFDHQGGDIVFSNLGRITSTAGNIDLTTSVGEIDMADGSYIRAVLGKVSLSSFNDMFIRQLVSGSSANDSIVLNITGTGNFEDAGNTTTAFGSADLISTGGVSILGGNNVVQLESQIARLESSSVNLVDVFLNEVDSITVADLTTTAGGGVQIIAGGDISVGEINSAGVVTLTSSGGIFDAGDDTVTDITAPSIVLSAAQKIGDLTGDITGTTDELDVDTTSISLTLTNELSASDVNEIAIRQTSIAGAGDLEITQLITPTSTNAARVSISSERNGVDLTAINWANALDSSDFLRVSALDLGSVAAGDILLGNLNTTSLAGLALTAVNTGQDIQINSTQSDLSTITLNVTDLLIKSGTSERLALTGATDVDGFISGGGLSITSAGALNLLDIDGDNFAISVEGNFAAQVATGDLNLSDTLVASDISNDGIRSGTLDFTTSAGNIFAGTSASGVQIISLNTFDQDAASTLTAAAETSADSDIAIRMRVMDRGSSTRNITLGNDAGTDDTVIRAQGGDIYLSAGEGARGTNVDLREFIVGTDVAITAFNDVLDAQTGTAILEEVNITAPTQLVVRAGRVVELTSKNLGGSLIDLTEQQQREVIEETEETTRPIPPPEPVVTQAVAFDNRYLGLVSEACLGQNPTSASSSCRQEIAMRQFLNAFLLDGQVPPIKARSEK